MGQVSIRKLDQIEVGLIYGTHMKEDFPPREIKPLERIFAMMEDDVYECTGLFIKGKMVAYAFFVKEAERGFYLLDYLAVHREYRNSGCGSIYLREMKHYFIGCKGIFLECESEAALKEWTNDTHEAALLRRKRICFYRNNGAVSTNLKSDLFGVDYTILYFPVHATAGEVDWYEEVEAIYDIMFPPRLRERIKLWKRFGSLLSVERIQKKDGEVMLHPAVSLCDALGIRKQVLDGSLRMIALVGSGGKTSTMYQLADELSEMGKKVIVTTSTHIAIPKHGQVVILEDAAEMDKIIWEASILVVGRQSHSPETKKIRQPLHPEMLLNYADIVLVEADGSRGLPAKVPSGWEPVIPEQTDLVLGCIGLQAVHKPWADVCFRFETDGGWLEKRPEDLVEPRDLAMLLFDVRAMKKGVGKLPYSVVLNQADGEKEKEAALRALRYMDGQGALQAAVTSYNKEILL